MEVINFIYMKKKGKNKEPRKFLFINRIGMQSGHLSIPVIFWKKTIENESW